MSPGGRIALGAFLQDVFLYSDRVELHVVMPVDGSDVEVKKLESEKVWKAPTKYLRQGEGKKNKNSGRCAIVVL